MLLLVSYIFLRPINLYQVSFLIAESKIHAGKELFQRISNFTCFPEFNNIRKKKKKGLHAFSVFVHGERVIKTGPFPRQNVSDEYISKRKKERKRLPVSLSLTPCWMT
jgi:hypothetical protein